MAAAKQAVESQQIILSIVQKSSRVKMYDHHKRFSCFYFFVQLRIFANACLT